MLFGKKKNGISTSLLPEPHNKDDVDAAPGNQIEMQEVVEEPKFRPSRAWLVSKKCVAESMDFDHSESVMWRRVSPTDYFPHFLLDTFISQHEFKRHRRQKSGILDFEIPTWVMVCTTGACAAVCMG